MLSLNTLQQKYPSFEKRDAALYYLGSSYEKLLLDTLALQTYNQVLEQFPQSSYRDKLLVGKQNIFYKANAYTKSDSVYMFIKREYPHSKVIDESHYIAGQVYNKLEKYNEAIESFKAVKSRSDYKSYAYYSLGQSYIHTEQYNSAIAVLKKTDNRDSLIYKKAMKIVGLLYYEKAYKQRKFKYIKQSFMYFTISGNEGLNYYVPSYISLLINCDKPIKSVEWNRRLYYHYQGNFYAKNHTNKNNILETIDYLNLCEELLLLKVQAFYNQAVLLQAKSKRSYDVVNVKFYCAQKALKEVDSLRNERTKLLDSVDTLAVDAIDRRTTMQEIYNRKLNRIISKDVYKDDTYTNIIYDFLKSKESINREYTPYTENHVLCADGYNCPIYYSKYICDCDEPYVKNWKRVVNQKMDLETLKEMEKNSQ